QASRIDFPCCDLETLLRYQSGREQLDAMRRQMGMLRVGEERGRRRGRRGRRHPLGPVVEESAESWAGVRDYLALKRRVEAQALAQSEFPCHRCPERRRLAKALKRHRKLLDVIQGRTRTLEHLQNSYWEQFLHVTDVLRHYGYLGEDGLSAEGILLAGLRHDNELLVARVAFSGTLEGLRSHEVMALLSCLVEEPRESEAYFARVLLKRVPHLRRRVRGMEELAEDLIAVQQRHRVFLPVSIHTTLIAAAYEWATGEEDWVHLVQGHYGGHEGDLIRAFRRLIDLARQLLESPHLPEPLRGALREGVRMVDRGIVFESALI
ncbi:MAG: hypothetical protein ACE5HK_07565, partial [Candidatus Methylomirabilales bacterium]